ncbi:MAG: imidazolonepropionase [Acidobacteriota bacterium]|nr:imidazolonepropionase [Acidobacteriota bacterium]
MTKCDLVIHSASQLLTCASGGKPKRLAQMRNVGLIKNGAIAAKDGVIIAVGGSDEILHGFEAENVIDAKGKTVAPGFVECHTHIVYAGNRLDEFELKIKGADYLEILAGGGGIISTVRQTREASLADLVELSAKRLDKILALGTTTCEIKTGYGLDTETELKMLEAIFELDKTHAVDVIPTFLPAHTVPPEFKGNADKYVNLICSEMLERAIGLFVRYKTDFEEVRPENTINKTGVRLGKSGVTCGIYDISEIIQNNPFFVDVFCEKNAFDLEQSRRVLETAKKLGFKLKAHVDEFTNLGGARMAIELGATSIDHLDKISDDEIRLLADSNTIGVVTPTVNFNLGSHEFADARKLIDAGCAVAVSTDYNPGSAPCPSLPAAMAIACRYQKLLPSEAFNAATINAAFAVGAGEKTGSLEIGKQADILIFEADDYRQIAYEFGGNFVVKAIKEGEINAPQN